MKHTFKLSLLFISLLVFGASSCKKEDTPDSTDNSSEVMVTQSMSYAYTLHNGQTVPSAPYKGMHPDDLMANMKVEELSNGKTRISVTLENTLDGKVYMIHAHDAADANSTPNNTPYSESPNSSLFVKMAEGNGGTVTVMQETDMSYSSIINDYNGFFVIHDPLQGMSTVDISTYLIVGAFARTQTASNLKSMVFDYAFNTGQVASSYAYSGSHQNTLSAKLKIQELGNGESRVSVWLMNTLDAKTYMVHAHDKADPSSTPNMTPYQESPNSSVCTLMIKGNGSTAWNNQISTMSYTQLTTMYEGFFVVHDPLQAISTVDPTTYVILGNFAR